MRNIIVARTSQWLMPLLLPPPRRAGGWVDWLVGRSAQLCQTALTALTDCLTPRASTGSNTGNVLQPLLVVAVSNAQVKLQDDGRKVVKSQKSNVGCNEE